MSPTDDDRKKPTPRKDVFIPQFVVIAMYAGLALVCVAMMLFTPDLRGYAFVALVFTIATIPMALRASSSAEGPSPRESFDRISQAIERLTHEGGLSETAKRIIHRKEERALLRKAIEQDISLGDYEAALILVKELAERFGYRADAEEFRARIERVRAQTLDKEVIASLESLEKMIRDRHWAESYAEAARITRLYPESHRVAGLRERVDQARSRHKQDLERRFLVCAEREQVDEAMTLLKELDQYLTEEEAEPFRELARGVIGKARDNLGVRFKLAVQDRAWRDAVEVGERIINDFPNSRMAQEVRGMLDMLRDRAESMSRS
ncbi:MAG: hypothetical protein EA379_06900 [Phycisphaerales bacterium]|nr:MAG: hypothetical protein EA379_06900 [Phycisphaerales bacterium]